MTPRSPARAGSSHRHRSDAAPRTDPDPDPPLDASTSLPRSTKARNSTSTSLPPRSPTTQPRHPASAAVTITASVVALSLLAGCATQVTGEAVAGSLSPQIGPPIKTDTVSLRHDYDDSPQEVNDYWTQDRRRGADTKDITPDDSADGSARPDAATGVVVDPSTGPVTDPTPIAPASTGDPFDARGLAASTQGRLYVTIGSDDYVCSATVVNAMSKDVVATAAHCLWDFAGDTGWATNVFFVPADADNGEVAPYGYWAAESAYGPQEFADNATTNSLGMVIGTGWTHDFAFLTMAADDDGQLIQDVTGGQGIAFGGTVDDVLVTGYPSAAPFDGLDQRFCASDDWFPLQGGAFGIECAMTQGASGGGWLSDYDTVTGAGYLVATTSFRSPTELGAMPLGEDALALFTEAGGL